MLMKNTGLSWCLTMDFSKANIKSWWYWNVSTKYDSLDLFVFVFFPAMIVLMLWMGFTDKIDKQHKTADCEAKGGVLISTKKVDYCIAKEALIGVR